MSARTLEEAERLLRLLRGRKDVKHPPWCTRMNELIDEWLEEYAR